MSVIEYELIEIRKLCENVVEQSKLISCEKTIVSRFCLHFQKYLKLSF